MQKKGNKENDIKVTDLINMKYFESNRPKSAAS